MSIYNLSGSALYKCYDLQPQEKQTAYDLTGNVVFSEPSSGIVVMEYNVGEWYIGDGHIVPAEKDEEYYALQNGMIASANPDIMLICENRQNFSEAGRTTLSMLSQYFPYIQQQGNSGYMSRAICSKYPFTNYTTHNFGDGESNYYDSCTMTIDGKTVTVIVTHLKYSGGSQATKLAQFATLMNYLATLDSFICGGDFNQLSCKDSSGSDYTDMIVPMLQAGYNVANCGDLGFFITYSNMPVDSWDGCLDNIVTSSDISIVSAHSDNTKLTDNIQDKCDHMPLVAVIEL